MSSDFRTLPAALVNLVIFNPSIGGESSEEAQRQICFFHPPATSLDNQARLVGVAQALITFTRTFSPNAPCETAHTRKHRIIFHQPEPDYWMLLKVRVGTQVRIHRDGKKTMEYLEHNLPDSALRAILVKAYEQFKLFHKGFHHLLASKSSLHLRETLDHFFTSYIPTLDIPTLDISTSLRGIHHLSLDKTTYLSLVSFIRDLESHLPPHTQLLFLYRHFLAWSNFTDPSALRVVYDYITDPDTGKVDDGIISQVKGKGEAVISTRPRGLRPVKQGVGHGLSSLFGLRREREKFSGFLVGPVGGEVPEPKKMYLGREGVECYVLLYQFHEDCTLPIFIPTEAPPDSDDDTIKQIKRRIRDRAFFSDLRLFFDERFPPLLKELADDWKRSRGESENDDTTARFVKLDKSNNGITTSIGVSKSSAVSEEALRNVGGLHEDFERNPNLDSVHMKTSADTWIVGQRSEHEESHFVVKKAEASLTDIEGELHKFQTLSLNNANAPAE